MKGTLKYITIIVVIVCFLANNTPIYASPALRPTNSKISGEGEVRSELASLNNNASAIDSVREMQNLLEEAIASNRNWERCTAEQLIEHIKDQFLEGKLPVSRYNPAVVALIRHNKNNRNLLTKGEREVTGRRLLHREQEGDKAKAPPPKAVLFQSNIKRFMQWGDKSSGSFLLANVLKNLLIVSKVIESAEVTGYQAKDSDRGLLELSRRFATRRPRRRRTAPPGRRGRAAEPRPVPPVSIPLSGKNVVFALIEGKRITIMAGDYNLIKYYLGNRKENSKISDRFLFNLIIRFNEKYSSIYIREPDINIPAIDTEDKDARLRYQKAIFDTCCKVFAKPALGFGGIPIKTVANKLQEVEWFLYACDNNAVFTQEAEAVIFEHPQWLFALREVGIIDDEQLQELSLLCCNEPTVLKAVSGVVITAVADRTFAEFTEQEKEAYSSFVDDFAGQDLRKRADLENTYMKNRQQAMFMKTLRDIIAKAKQKDNYQGTDLMYILSKFNSYRRTSGWIKNRQKEMVARADELKTLITDRETKYRHAFSVANRKAAGLNREIKDIEGELGLTPAAWTPAQRQALAQLEHGPKEKLKEKLKKDLAQLKQGLKEKLEEKLGELNANLQEETNIIKQLLAAEDSMTALVNERYAMQRQSASSDDLAQYRKQIDPQRDTITELKNHKLPEAKVKTPKLMTAVGDITAQLSPFEDRTEARRINICKKLKYTLTELYVKKQQQATQKRQLPEKEGDLADLQDAIRKAEGQLADRRGKKLKRKERGDAVQALQQQRQTEKAGKDDLDKLKRDISEAEREIATLMDEAGAIEKELEAFDGIKQREREALEERLERLKRIAGARGDREYMEAELPKIPQQRELLEQLLVNENDMSRRDLLHEMQATQAGLGSLGSRTTAKHTTLMALLGENEQNQKEKMGESRTLTKQRGEIQREAGDLKAEIKKLNDQMGGLDDTEEGQKERAKLEGQKEEKQKKLETKEEEARRLKDQITPLDKEIESLEKTLTEMRNELGSLGGKKQKEHERLTERLGRLKEILAVRDEIEVGFSLSGEQVAWSPENARKYLRDKEQFLRDGGPKVWRDAQGDIKAYDVEHAAYVAYNEFLREYSRWLESYRDRVVTGDRLYLGLGGLMERVVPASQGHVAPEAVGTTTKERQTAEGLAQSA